MCKAVTCRTCGKATWEGCGQHVDEALAGVPAEQRCEGHAGEEHKPEGWFGRLLGRG